MKIPICWDVNFKILFIIHKDDAVFHKSIAHLPTNHHQFVIMPRLFITHCLTPTFYCT